MPNAYDYTYPSPLAGYENLPALPNEIDPVKRSYINPPTGKLSASYETFTAPLDNGPRGGFDLHIYYLSSNPSQVKFATELWERIRREFPELDIYRFWDRPVGPHPVAMFEVNLYTPAQFGAFVPWLVINRGPLSVLLHPNTTGDEKDEERDHSQRATWMGERFPLDLGVFRIRKEPKKEGE